MCGIAGIIQSDPTQFSNYHLSEMTDALSHRGPDGAFQWHNEDNRALLAHRRLSIIDLSDKAIQPMRYMDRYTIVHNGEIYNYLELKEELRKSGYQFKTESDTEVIMAAYDQWEGDCLQHFDGMFAFAIWDQKEKELFAARDRFGEKPFFYFFDGNTFAFASEMKALWAIGIQKDPNLQMLFNFITIGYTDNPAQPDETFYKNICKLPPASWLSYSCSDTELVVDRYWDLDLKNNDTNISEINAIENFSSLLKESLNRRLRSDVPIGTSLSGGLDSSSIIALLTDIGQGKSVSKAFTATFPGFENDEAAFAANVAKNFNLEQHTLTLTSNDLLNDWDKLCYHQEEPFGSASIYAQYKVYELAEKNSIRVLLDGQGADEILAGYPKYYKWYWQELFVKRKLMSSHELQYARDNGVSEPFNVRNIIASLFPDIASVVLEKQYLFKALRHDDLTREFVKQQSREAYYATPEYFNLKGALYFNTCIHGLEELLRYADRNSMAHGREVRLPFLSHKLVEFMFSLPSHFKIRKGWTKWILRQTMNDKLPESIVWRKDKIGFEPPQKEWMSDKKVIDAVMESRKKLVSENILKNTVLQKPVIPLSSHAPDNFDWRYLSAAAFL